MTHKRATALKYLFIASAAFLVGYVSGGLRLAKPLYDAMFR